MNRNVTTHSIYRGGKASAHDEATNRPRDWGRKEKDAARKGLLPFIERNIHPTAILDTPLRFQLNHYDCVTILSARDEKESRGNSRISISLGR